ncbi:hypothetical protein pb186bvf_009925 [Paramecium bursaria]
MINLSLKQTKLIDYSAAIYKYIMDNYGDQSIFDQVCQPAVNKLQELRKELDFEKFNISIAVDQQLASGIEPKILDYIRYLTLFRKNIRFESNEQKAVMIKFNWTDSYDVKKLLEFQSARYELICYYYNLAVVDYIIGHQKLNSENDGDRKAGISKLRNGLWALSQLRDFKAQISTQLQDQAYDLSTPNLETLEHLLSGLCYKALYSNMIPSIKQLGVETVAATLVEAVKEFTIASSAAEQLNEKKMPKQLIQQFKNVIKYNLLWSLVNMAQTLAPFFYAKIDIEPRGQNMGKALGFIVRAQSALNQVLADKNSAKIYTPQQMEAIKSLEPQLTQLYQTYNLKNTQIYKEQIVAENNLPFPPLVPPAFTQDLPEVECFASFVSEEGIQLAREIKTYVEQQKYELESTFKQLLDQKNQAYTENYVSAFLDMYQSKDNKQEQQIPASVLERINAIRRRGGQQGVDQMIQRQKETAIYCAQTLGQVDTSLQAERAEDDRLRAQYQARWTMQPSAASNAQFYKSLSDYQNKLKEAQKIDFQVMQNYQLFAQYAQLAIMNDHQIAQQIPKAEDNSDFVNSNMAIFSQLVQSDQSVLQTIEESRQIIIQVCNIIAQTNYQQSAVIGLKNGSKKEDMFQQSLEPIINLINQFNERMGAVTGRVHQVIGLAGEVSKVKRTNQNLGAVQDQISQGLKDAASFIDNLDHSILFYEQLKQHTEELDKTVKDWLMARGLQKEQLLESFNNQPKPQIPPSLPQPQPQPSQVPHQQYPPQYPPYPQQQYPAQYPHPNAYQQPATGYQGYPQQGYPQQPGYPQQAGYPQYQNNAYPPASYPAQQQYQQSGYQYPPQGYPPQPPQQGGQRVGIGQQERNNFKQKALLISLQQIKKNYFNIIYEQILTEFVFESK